MPESKYFCSKCKRNHFFNTKIGLQHQKDFANIGVITYPKEMLTSVTDAEIVKKFKDKTLTRQEYEMAEQRWNNYTYSQRMNSKLGPMLLSFKLAGGWGKEFRPDLVKEYI